MRCVARVVACGSNCDWQAAAPRSRQRAAAAKEAALCVAAGVRRSIEYSVASLHQVLFAGLGPVVCCARLAQSCQRHVKAPQRHSAALTVRCASSQCLIRAQWCIAHVPPVELLHCHRVCTVPSTTAAAAAQVHLETSLVNSNSDLEATCATAEHPAAHSRLISTSSSHVPDFKCHWEFSRARRGTAAT